METNAVGGAFPHLCHAAIPWVAFSHRGDEPPPQSWVGVRTEAEPALLIPPGLGRVGGCWWIQHQPVTGEGGSAGNSL